ncbi:beta-glucosidase [Spirosomataceae bacterium TFI 002]|nr:beta-glucosidase [Spirosomataceae bacterium TFI 002]
MALVGVSFFSTAQKTTPPFLQNYNQNWVDSVFNSLTLDQKVGQLLMPRGNNSGQGYNPEKLKQWVKDYHIGGVVMFAGQPSVQAAIVNELQAISHIPMLIGQDFEWGLAMRLDSTVRFPYQMGLGAIRGNTDLIYEMGVEIAKQCKRIGVHVNYAPVVDINNNPNNPVINFRSFGEDKNEVSAKALAYMKGMQSQNLMVTAKHFPGHGDTGVDSHYDLPVIKHNKARLSDVELFPYKELIANGLTGVMTAHLSIPALDKSKNLASTMSKPIVTELLRNELGFEGLTFTDAMDMQGAVKYYPNGKALVMAILAGNDILETFEDVPTAVNAIKAAIESKELPMEILDARVKKILKAKSWVGLDRYQPAKIENLVADLNTYESEVLNAKIAEQMITLVKNQNDILPLKDLTQKIAFISIDEPNETVFQEMAARYTYVDRFAIAANASDEEVQSIHDAAHSYDKVVVALHLASIRPTTNYGITTSTQFALDALLENENVVVCVFGNAYSLAKLNNLEKAKGLVMAYQNTFEIQQAAAQAIFGAIPFKGKLPVNVNETYKINQGVELASIGRLSYGFPEQEGVNSVLLNARIDSVVNFGLNQKAYPGAVTEVAKNGRIIYRKAFGYHTYEAAELGADFEKRNSKTFEAGKKTDVMDNKNPFEPENAVRTVEKVAGVKYAPKGAVRLGDIYDFASVTKISTSALAVMQMMTNGQFSLDDNFGKHYEPFRASNKAELTFRDMLTHRSGLKAWIPFWMDCIDTTATIKNGLDLNPELITRFTYQPLPKRNWFQRVFGKAPDLKIDTLGSIAKNEDLWLSLLSTETIAWKPGIFSKSKTEQYNIEIADQLWMNKDHVGFIYNQIKDSPVKPDQGYVYSDLHYYTYPQFVPKIVGEEWETYLKKTYKKLGANTLTYNPRNYYALDRIVPTEMDTLFRKGQIHGRVHDEGAGMLRGISGHAGLFGSAEDLLKLTQMYLQKGYYGGERFISEEVIEECTKYQFDPKVNRRAIAFDKLHPDKSIANGPQMASPSSYGHSGYTGTFTWIDPEYNMSFVFFSNRVYPTRDNNKISSLNIRTEVGNQIIRTLKGE